MPEKNERNTYEGYDLGSLITYTVDIQEEYTKCAILHDELINTIEVENKKIRENNKK